MFKKSIHAILILAIACSLIAASRASEPSSPLQPREAISHMKVRPGLKVQLVAAEPQVVDPVAVRFDARGRMWVVEMRDYPTGPAAGEQPQSRIRILEDADGDGFFEKASTFASGLTFPTGLQPWKGGVIVTLAGAVVYMKDTTGDGKADLQQTWYEGFTQDNTQLRANHPRLGLDRQIYVANGLRGGEVHNPRKAGSRKINLRGGDFRFDPHTFEYAADSGAGQFGLTFDNFGNRFVCSNRNPLKHMVLTSDMLRDTTAAIAATGHDVAAAGAASKLFPISNAWTTSTLHANQFTAACGVHIYNGSAIPELNDVGFTCDPTGNLVHGERLHPHGATFRAEPLRQGVEFLASTDTWFRPVNLTTGPDGALYVVDMYRAVIEHPRWMPAELKTRRDLLDGNTKGRIYRVVPAEDAATQKSHPVAMDTKTSQQLVRLLSHRNSWQRNTAARLLLERQDESANASLRKLARSASPATARVWALSLLMGSGSLSTGDLLAALGDADPRIREQAIRVAAKHFRGEQQLRQKLVQMHDDPDARVRFQLAFALAPVENEAELASLTHIAERGAGDPWTRRAVIVAAGKKVNQLATELLTQLTVDTPNPQEEQLLLETTSLAAKDQTAARQLMADSLTSTKISTRLKMQLVLAICKNARWQANDIATVQRLDAGAVREFKNLTEAANKQSTNAAADSEARLLAIELLGFTGETEKLLQLAGPGAAPQIRIQAINALARQHDLKPWKQLLPTSGEMSPAVRTALMNSVLQRSERIALLLDEIEAGRMRSSSVDRTAASRLLKHPDEKIRTRARTLLASAVASDRVKALAKYQSALQMTGHATKGKAVFTKNCATCHRIGETGVDVAPDIADSRTKTPAQLLGDILQPNRAIDAAYIGYTVVLQDGSVLSGVITDETAAAITLKQPGGKSQVIARADIEQLVSSGASLMPDGLEKEIDLQQMADLLKFIKHWRYEAESIPLQQP